MELFVTNEKGDTKTQRARLAGLALAKIIKEKAIEKVVFDRNGYLYHGRIASFVEGIRWYLFIIVYLSYNILCWWKLK